MIAFQMFVSTNCVGSCGGYLWLKIGERFVDDETSELMLFLLGILAGSDSRRKKFPPRKRWGIIALLLAFTLLACIRDDVHKSKCYGFLL